MGNFSLTNPGLAYDQGVGVDPTTGLPVQIPPIIKYFKNPALRAQQSARDEMATVQPSRSQITGPNGGPALIPAAEQTGVVYPNDPNYPRVAIPSNTGAGIPSTARPLPVTLSPAGQDQTQVSESPAPLSQTPTFFKPSFGQTTTDANGLQSPINPAQTKLGKLMSILGAAARGAAAGWGTGNAAAGADRAREIPIQTAMQRQQLTAGTLENQQRMAALRSMPLDIAQRQASIEQTLQQIQGERYGAAQFIPRQDPQSGELVYQGIDRFGNPVGPGVKGYVSPYTLRPHLSPVAIPNPNDPTGQPIIANYNKLSGHVEDDAGNIIPGAEKFIAGMVPKTTSETETTDLMGNTRSSRVTGPVGSAPGGFAGRSSVGSAAAPGPQTPYAGASPTGAGMLFGTQPQRAPVNMVQKGPLVPAIASAPRRNAGPAAAGGSVSTPTQSAAATSPIYSLAPDVEQRLQTLVPKNEQGFMRSILQYKAPLPSMYGRSAPQYSQAVNLASQIDPSFSAQNYDLIRKVKSDFGPGGSVGKQVLAFNTALNHMGLLYDAAQQLQNGKLQLANKLANALSIQFGNDAVTNFNTIKTYLQSELAKGFGGGVPTDASRAEAEPILANFQSPKQIGGAFSSAAKLLQGKISAQEAAYSQAPPLGTGQKVGLIGDEGHGVLQKLGVEAPQMVTFADSNGQPHQILAADWKKNQNAILRKDPGAKLIQ